MFASIVVLMIGRQMWWKSSYVSCLLAFNLPLGTDGDRLTWKLTKNGDFTIHSYYHKLLGSSSAVFPQKGIWKVKAPCCVSFFFWIVAWDRILTGDNLRLRGYDFVYWRIMCRCCSEIVDHLLLHCGKAYQLWCFVFRTFGISWVPLRCKIVYLVGGISWGSIHLTFGIQFRYV